MEQEKRKRERQGVDMAMEHLITSMKVISDAYQVSYELYNSVIFRLNCLAFKLMGFRQIDPIKIEYTIY